MHGEILNAEDSFYDFQNEITVKGKVVDQSGVPMIGVTIIEQGTRNGVVTDFDGNFSITVPEQATLEVRYVGYKTQLVDDITEEMSPLTIQMEPDVGSLEEVVVVGYGVQEKESVVASISQVDGEDLQQSGSTTTVSESLQGMMPGLTVTNSDGLPGKGAHDITIRGVSTWQNTYPLTIVDGVERNFNMVDPNSIETISILKDASATAVYGVRGANGVILITTKRGRVGDPTFQFSSNYGIKLPTKGVEHADYLTTMTLYNEALRNDGLWTNLIPESEFNAWRENIDQAGPYNDYFPQINWWDEVVKDYGTQQQYNLNVRGGTDFMKYFVSLGYVHDGDIFNTEYGQESEVKEFNPAFGFERYNWRSNLDFDITESTKFSISFAGNSRKRFQPVFGPSTRNIISRVRTLPTNVFPIKYSDGEWGDSPTGGDNFLQLINEGGQEIHKDYEGFYDAKLRQKLDFITQGLSFKAKIAYTSSSRYFSSIYRDRSDNPNASLSGTVRYYRQWDYSNPIVNPDGTVSYPLLSETRYPSEEYQGGRPINATYDAYRGYHRNLFYEFATNYNRSFGEHDVTALALMNRQTRLGDGGGPILEFPSYREDWVGRITYSYRDKYLLEVNGAYTGSEKFARGNRYGFFPSYAVGWVLSEEPFVEDLTGDFLNFLKVRYSQGEMGSDFGSPRFAYVQLYSSGGNAWFGYDNLTSYGPLYKEGQAANPDQTWETSLKRNLGVDFRLLDSRLSGSVDLYNERRTGILMGLRTVPVWFGARAPSGNIGETKNRGYELVLKWRDRIGSDFNYFVSANLSQFENRIVFMDDPRLEDDYLKNAGKPIRWDRHAPLIINNGFYGSLDDIYNQAPANLGTPMNNIIPGDLMYVDFNADGLVDIQDKVAQEHQLYPKTVYGLNLGFGYKNFDVSARVYGVTDVGRTIGNGIMWDYLGGAVMAHPDVATRWTPETAATAQKPALHIANDHNMSQSDFQYVDGSYARLKSAEISYTLNAATLDIFNLDRMQIYMNGNNLFTWVAVDTKVDPEAFGGNTYPVVKRYNMGLRVTF